MKKIFFTIILLLAFTFQVQAATYYVDYTLGSDSNNGTGTGTAWKTVAHVNDCAESSGSGSCPAGFSSGDIIQFKRGEVWSSDETLGRDASLHVIAWGSINGLTIQDYGSGNLPKLDGNTQQPIYISGNDWTLQNLTIKNLNMSGLDWNIPTDNWNYSVRIEKVNGLTLDGLYMDGRDGASTYRYHYGAIGPGNINGNLEIKNCTIQNYYKTMNSAPGEASPWGIDVNADMVGIEPWDPDATGKTTGTVSIHDNVIQNIYADAIQIGGYKVAYFKIYNNTIDGFGENAIDLKACENVEIYNNDISHNDFGFSASIKNYFSWPGSISLDSAGDTSTWTVGGSNIKVHDNYLHDMVYLTIGQGYVVNSEIYNNYFDDAGLAVYLTYSGMKVHDNLFKLTGGVFTLAGYGDSSRSALKTSSEFTTSNNDIVHNVFYISDSNYKQGIMWAGKTGETGNIIKNNIIQMTTSSAYPAVKVTNGSTSIMDIDSNDYYNLNNTLRVSWNGTSYTTSNFSSWQGLDSNAHANDISSDPLLNLTYLSLTAGSGAIGEGNSSICTSYPTGLAPLSMLSTYGESFDTISRTQTGQCDMGAKVADTTAPTTVSSGPSGNLSFSTSKIIYINLDEDVSACKYDSSDVAYDSMANSFGNCSGVGCDQSVSVSEGSNTFYARCADIAGNKQASSTTITFTVQAEEEPSEPSPNARGQGFNLSGGSMQ